MQIAHTHIMIGFFFAGRVVWYIYCAESFEFAVYKDRIAWYFRWLVDANYFNVCHLLCSWSTKNHTNPVWCGAVCVCRLLLWRNRQYRLCRIPFQSTTNLSIRLCRGIGAIEDLQQVQWIDSSRRRNLCALDLLHLIWIRRPRGWWIYSDQNLRKKSRFCVFLSVKLRGRGM